MDTAARVAHIGLVVNRHSGRAWCRARLSAVVLIRNRKLINGRGQKEEQRTSIQEAGCILKFDN